MANTPTPTPTPAPAADDVVPNDPSTSMQAGPSPSAAKEEKKEDVTTPYSYQNQDEEKNKDKKSPEQELIETLKRMFGCGDTENDPTKAMQNDTQYKQMADQNHQQAQAQPTANVGSEAEAGAAAIPPVPPI